MHLLYHAKIFPLPLTNTVSCYRLCVRPITSHRLKECPMSKRFGSSVTPSGGSYGGSTPSRGYSKDDGKPIKSAPYGYDTSGKAYRPPRDNQPINTSGHPPFNVQADASGWSTTGIMSYSDKVLVCKDCRRSFTWMYQEQIKYAQRGTRSRNAAPSVGRTREQTAEVQSVAAHLNRCRGGQSHPDYFNRLAITCS